ncbi:hypothetical protein Droror1_Dr00016291 [Drosera rotundifolia]
MPDPRGNGNGELWRRVANGGDARLRRFDGGLRRRPSYRVKIGPAVQAGWHCCWATAGRVAICQGRPTEPLVSFVQTGLVAELVADEGNTRKKDSGNPPRARVAVLSCC